jgi:uracil-DNA glycosylase family 4
MTARRDSLLQEIGLGPIWKLRNKAVQPMPDEPDLGYVKAESVPMLLESSAIVGDRAGEIAAMTWDGLRQSVAACQACPLCKARKQAVLGVGDTSADWLFVGEGPGAEEDERGEPFVGQAGKLLDAMMAAIDIRRGENVYIANVVKCRPPNNRTPEPEEAATCWPYLQRQIALLQPKLIVALGRPAAQALLGADVKIGAARGRIYQHGDIPVIVTYHPAYLLRTLPDKAKAWEDLCFARRHMRQLPAG